MGTSQVDAELAAIALLEAAERGDEEAGGALLRGAEVDHLQRVAVTLAVWCVSVAATHDDDLSEFVADRRRKLVQRLADGDGPSSG